VGSIPMHFRQFIFSGPLTAQIRPNLGFLCQKQRIARGSAHNKTAGSQEGQLPAAYRLECFVTLALVPCSLKEVKTQGA
jgi:hypothetical protein